MNLDAVMAQSHDISRAKQTVSDVKTSLDSLSRRVDPKIQARKNIGSRLKSTASQLAGIQDKLSRIQSTVESGVNSYYSTEMRLTQEARRIGDR